MTAVELSGPEAEGPGSSASGEEPSDRNPSEDPGPRRPAPATIAAVVVVTLCVAVGLLLRYRYYTGIEPGPDSDEAEMGLLGMEFIRGEWPLLMRNQPYGGTPWLWVLGPSVRLLGLNAWGLRVPINVLGLVNAGLLGLIGVTLGWSRRRAAVAAAAVWCYPLAAVSFASRETLYFIPAITGGLVALLLVLRSERRRVGLEDPLAGDRRAAVLLALSGFAAGVAFWVNPGAFYLVVPTFAWLLIRSLRSAFYGLSWRARIWDVVRPMGLAAIGFLVGALPWWFLTVLGPARRDNYAARPRVPLLDRLEFFAREQVPGWFGFRVPYGADLHGDWLGGTAWKVGFVAVAVLVVVQVVRRKGLRDETVVTALALAVPAVYLMVTAKAGPLYTNLRYITFASPVLVLVVAAKWRRDLAAVAALGLLPVVAFAGSQAWNPAPYLSLDPVVRVLEERGTRCVLGDYWAGGHRLMFETGERIIAVPTYENRNPKYPALARDLGNCAWLYRDGQAAAGAFEGWLGAQGIEHETVRPGPGFVLYFPERRVWLDEVPPEALAG